MEVRDLFGRGAGIAGPVRQRGQAMVEYAFILVLIALVVITLLVVTGRQVTALYSDITTTLHAAGM